MSLAIRVTDRQSNKISRACVEPLLILMIETYWRIMNLKFRTVRSVGMFFGLSALLFVQAAPLFAQQIPASELPPAGHRYRTRGQIRSAKWNRATDPRQE